MRDALYIDGRWIAARDGGTIEVIDPATERPFASVAAGTEADVELAVEAAGRALRGDWGRTTGAQRAKVLRTMAAGIRDRAEAIARLEVADNGKPLPEAVWDVADAAQCFDYYADLADALDQRQGEAVPLTDHRFRCTLLHQPVGVAGLVIPWNYPFLMAAWKVAPALAAGCTAVLKPSEVTPLSALLLGEIGEVAGLPPGVLNIVTGLGARAGAALVAHPGVAKVSFTGSVPTGRAILAATAPAIKAVNLELGGKSPMVAFADADIDTLVEWVMFGIFWNQGQVCSATSRVLVERPIYDRVLDRLVVESRRIAIGPGLQPGVKLGPLVSGVQRDKVVGRVRSAVADGARLVSGGERPSGLERGYFLEPTILDRVSEDAPAWREEIFGPVLCVRPFDSEEEAIALANRSRFGLAAAVMSTDLERCERVASRLEAGVVWVNCCQPTFVEAPWGGIKESGIGRELGPWGLDNFLSIKQVTRYVSELPWGWYGSVKE